MHLLRSALAGTAALAALALADCDPAATTDTVVLRQAVTGRGAGGTLTCEPPFSRGDNAGPVLTWKGDVAGEPTTVFIAALTADGSLSRASVDRGTGHWGALDYPLWPDPPNGLGVRANPYKYSLTFGENGSALLRAVLPAAQGSVPDGLLQIEASLHCPAPAT